MEDSGDLRERTIVIHEIVSDANDVEFTRELADDRNALLWFRHLQDEFMLAVANCADDSIYRINAPQQNPNRSGWRYIRQKRFRQNRRRTTRGKKDRDKQS